MKEVKYPLFGQWLNKSRGSISLKTVGRWIGRAHNSVSDYEKGYVQPPRDTVAFLINIFKGDPLEIAGFLHYDPIELEELCNLQKTLGQSTTNFKDECLRKINSAHTFRIIERPSNALKMVEECAYLLESRIKTRVDSQKDIQDYKYMLLKTYGEKIGCLTLLLPREKVLYAVIPIYTLMNKLVLDIENDSRGDSSIFFNADACDSLSFSGSAYCDCWLAAAYFVEKQYDRAIRYQTKSIPFCGFDKHQLAETHRGLLLGLAHKNKVPETKKTIRKIRKLFGDEIKDPVDVDSLRCAIAEAKMLIGEQDANEVLAEVEGSIYRSIRFLPLKRIQYYKAKLFLERSNLLDNRKVDRKSIEQITEEGTSLAYLYGFERHMNEIARIGCRLIDIEENILLADIDLANRPRLTEIYKDMQENKVDEKNESLK